MKINISSNLGKICSLFALTLVTLFSNTAYCEEEESKAIFEPMAEKPPQKINTEETKNDTTKDSDIKEEKKEDSSSEKEEKQDGNPSEKEEKQENDPLEKEEKAEELNKILEESVDASNKVEEEIKTGKLYIGMGITYSKKKGNHKKIYKSDIYSYDLATKKWTKSGKFPGGSRAGMIAMNVNNKIYMGMGVDEDKNSKKSFEIFHKDMYVYNPTDKSWTESAEFITGLRTEMSYFVINGVPYLGLGRFGAKIFNDIYKLNEEKETWDKYIKFNQKDTPKAVFVINNCLYFLGHNLFMYDMKSKKWTKKKKPPFDCAKNLLFVIKDKAYIGIGEYNNKSQSKKKKKEKAKVFSNNVYMYDSTNDKWTKITAFTGEERTNFVTITLHNKGYIGMGENNKGKTLKDIYTFDPNTNTWTHLTDFPEKGRAMALGFGVK